MKTYFILIVNLIFKMRIYHSHPMFIGGSKIKNQRPFGQNTWPFKVRARNLSQEIAEAA